MNSKIKKSSRNAQHGVGTLASLAQPWEQNQTDSMDVCVMFPSKGSWAPCPQNQCSVWIRITKKALILSNISPKGWIIELAPSSEELSSLWTVLIRKGRFWGIAGCCNAERRAFPQEHNLKHVQWDIGLSIPRTPALAFNSCHPTWLSICPEGRFFSVTFSYVQHCQFYILTYLQII